MRRPAAENRPIVVKIGSSSLTSEHGGIDPGAIAHVVANVVASWDLGRPAVLVSSGAIAAGFPVLGLATRPTDLPGLQVAASVGQGRLMAMYSAEFGARDRQVGQVLLTRDVLARREQYLNARTALERMLGLGVVPIVNENDTVVVDEVKVGDNDSLAAIVSHLVGAGMMILLTDTPGIYSNDPLLSDTVELLTAVRDTDEILDRLRSSTSRGAFGSGGVATKIAAARMAAWSGVPTVIASATESDVVARAVAGEDVGTWIDPRESGLSARRLWIAFGTPSEGTIEIDAGAASALSQGGKSLLAVGVTAVTGGFGAGAAVEVVHAGELIAKGLTSLSSEQVRQHRGAHSAVSGGEVIHRDDLVVLS
ncbi:MAG TPA: glutamate 5-kinase [Acidimicrobiia bacterium]|nr:glutamate 5-kinase [Acidimicrobiia bacterium]